MDEFDVILEILSDFLGDPKKVYEHSSQVAYNCPNCDGDENKGNLEINIEKGVFKCWSCESEGTHGTVGKLFDLYGNSQLKKEYEIIRPDEFKKVEKKVEKLRLPDSYTLFKDSSPRYPIRNQAYNYLKNRGITDEMIEKYNIGFCDTGSHSGRIVIPSYNKKGELNYYIARSWDVNSRAKYKNPKTPKDEIIFNENLIKWSMDIYLVEGAFDSVFKSNSIPMLGKHMSTLLFETLYDRAKANIIIALDGDAYDSALKLYYTLNGGELYGRIKIVKLPKDKDIADLRGEIDEYYIEIK
jgi:DNA primase